MTRRELALAVWKQELGQPYVWGGDDPIAGWDCSGLVIEGLKASGILPREGDWTAAALAARFRGQTTTNPGPGCLIFWKRGERIVHVEIAYAKIEDILFSIGASGGGSATTDRSQAIRSNAYVKIRPALGWTLAVDPF
jgi:hypothetical protein